MHYSECTGPQQSAQTSVIPGGSAEQGILELCSEEPSSREQCTELYRREQSRVQGITVQWGQVHCTALQSITVKTVRCSVVHQSGLQCSSLQVISVYGLAVQYIQVPGIAVTLAAVLGKNLCKSVCFVVWGQM